MNLIDSGGVDSNETTYSRTLEIQERYTAVSESSNHEDDNVNENDKKK